MKHTLYRFLPSLRSCALIGMVIFISFHISRVLQHYARLDAVEAAVATALLWAVLPLLLLQKWRISRFLMLDAVYVGAFVAMDAALVSERDIAFASVLAAIIYLLLNRLLAGLGGRLGVSAFLSCCLLWGVRLWLP